MSKIDIEQACKIFTDATGRKPKLAEVDAVIIGFQKATEAQKCQCHVLRLDDTWPLIDVLRKLVEASDILLHKRDYDQTGWEEHEYAYRDGLKIIEQLNQPMYLKEAQKQTAMSLEECKHSVALRYGYDVWEEFVADYDVCEFHHDEVAELYANQFREAQKWVSVDSDIMPPFEEKTQIICGDGQQYMGYFNGADKDGKHFWFCDNNDYHYPTHWTTLHEAP
jgi:hypothetical protein